MLLRVNMRRLDHKRLGHFTSVLMWNRNDRTIRNQGRSQKMCLQLGGRHLQTLDLDKLLDPIHDKHMLVPGRRLTDDGLVTSHGSMAALPV